MKRKIRLLTIDLLLRKACETREPPACRAHRSKIARASSIFCGLRWLSYYLCFAYLLTANPGYATDRKNPHGGLQLVCESCHTTISWRPIRSKLEFDHNHDTRYPLRGLHEGVACTSCHRSLVFNNVGAKCADCHADIHRRQFGPRCEDCHTVQGWKVNVQSVRNHLNRFPLLGAHAAVDCDSCHPKAATGVYIGLSTDCVSCHLKDYQSTTSPNHASANFPLTCQTCHGVDRWQGAKFNHAQVTGFALVGAHAQLDCNSCHKGQQYKGTPRDCFGCHAQDFNRTTNPNHVAANFPKDCAICHDSEHWQGVRFDHSQTGFALTGAHVTARCDSCHQAGRYKGTPRDCFSCHVANYEGTQNPDHRKANISTQCDSCHTTSNWQGAKFDHTKTKFALTGAHLSVSCAQCHVGGRFSGTPADCVSCHLKDFEGTTSPSHIAANFSRDCTVCHTTQQWKGAKFDHTKTRFPLTGAHINTSCTQCHTSGKYTGTSTQCIACHQSDYNGTTNPNHLTAGFSQNCTACHTTQQWKGAKFDHSNTKFALTGAHASVSCTQCHVGGQYAGTAMQCIGCHKAAYNSTSNPNHVAAGFPQDCTVCHNTVQWKGARFDHNAATKFPLTGAHINTSCVQCHTNGQYSGTSTQCIACHQSAYNSTTNPNHVSAGFSQNCTVCHTTQQWKGAKFDHNNTKFALTGAHVSVSCAQCHVGGRFAGTPTNCVSCHSKDFDGTTSPNHRTANFPQDCTVCHTTQQWKGAKFDHTKTRFPLTGAHITTSCAQCHINGVYTGTSTQCVACHQSDYNGAKNPNHLTAGFPKDCIVCHTTTGWKGARFDHNSTRFPLTGSHTSVSCDKCHVGGQYTGTTTQCFGCHKADYNATTNPNHAAAGFPQDCTVCHNTVQWKGARFDHSGATKFPLTGAHVTVSCSQCHLNNRFAGTPSDCVSCHQADYNGTTNPNHKAAGFPQTCATCHTTAQWKGARFDHSTATHFPLTGAHVNVACTQCHANNRFAGTPTDCASCHLSAYNGTTNPNHVTAGFPKDCSLCHTTAAWPGAKFDHSQTKFPLTGAHVSLTCSNCHSSGKYVGLDTSCVSCHLKDFNATTNPNHAAAGFPQDCQTCHSTTQWKGAVFDHSKTRFPLTGAHRTVTCVSCHIGGRYAGTPMDCYSCHRTVYETVSNPNHLSAGFPKTCETCHTTSTWTGATFNHKFPIYSGTHKGKWTTCNDCHTNPANYTLFSCTNCHAHDKAPMDQKHSGVRNYVYNSVNCYACHPTGSN